VCNSKNVDVGFQKLKTADLQYILRTTSSIMYPKQEKSPRFWCNHNSGIQKLRPPNTGACVLSQGCPLKICDICTIQHGSRLLLAFKFPLLYIQLSLWVDITDTLQTAVPADPLVSHCHS